MREVLLEVPKVKWTDIGGQHELKKRLEEMVVWPIRYAHALDRLHVQVPKGILMYGPPGCSKTMVAKAIATESGLNFIAVKVCFFEDFDGRKKREDEYFRDLNYLING